MTSTDVVIFARLNMLTIIPMEAAAAWCPNRCGREKDRTLA